MAKRQPVAVAALLALIAAPFAGDARADDDALSRLAAVDVTPGEERVTVRIEGSKAPDFTSFVMEDPFRVVVDWAGSRLSDEAGERRFERGLVRRLQTRQFDSEAERISTNC